MSSISKSSSFISKIKTKKWLLLIGCIFISVTVWFTRNTFFKKNAEPQYQTAQVERGTLVVSITGSGSVSTANSTSINTQASGVVSKVYVQEGQVVKAGTPIAKIELDLSGKQKAQQALASYQSAKNQLAGAQADLYSLQSKLFQANQKFMNGAVANGLAKENPDFIEQDADWLASEATYKNQQAVISQAQLSVSQSWLSYQETSDTIYAPISGTITGLGLQTGVVIANSGSSSGTSTATKVANIITDGKPTVKINLTEIDIPKIKVGDKATVIFDALSDKTYVGKVVSIDTVGAVSSGVTTYPVIVQLNDANTGILPNMAATASIITDTVSDTLLVPSSAVQKSTDQTTVRIMKNGKIENMTVQTGLASDTQVAITSGLKEGDVVVTAIIQPTAGRSATGTSAFSALGGNTRGVNGGFAGGAARTGGTGGARQTIITR
jgi:macrolide-specific efflux system membrane fusion protein